MSQLNARRLLITSQLYGLDAATAKIGVNKSRAEGAERIYSNVLTEDVALTMRLVGLSWHFLLVGIFMGVLTGRMPDIVRLYHLDYGTLGLILMLSIAGKMILLRLL